MWSNFCDKLTKGHRMSGVHTTLHSMHSGQEKEGLVLVEAVERTQVHEGQN